MFGKGSNYYPFGLSMSGVSSKAEGTLENKKKYNSYELNTDFDIDISESFYRTHDPQLGRWWQIDPKPLNHFESPFVCMGNNPISNFDLLGDIFRGANETYASRSLAAMISEFSKMKGTEALLGLFKLSDDKVTFAGIDEAAFNAAIKDLSPEAQALAQGYFSAINDQDNIYYAAIVKGGDEKIDLSDAKTPNGVKLNELFGNYAGKTMNELKDLKMSSGGGTSNFLEPNKMSYKKGGIGIILVNSGYEKPLSDVISSDGKNANYVPTADMILNHELNHMISFGRQINSLNYDRKVEDVNSNINAVKADNLYFKATNSNYQRTGVSSHGIQPSQATGIPDHLKPRL